MENLCKRSTEVLPEWISKEVSRRCAASFKKLKRDAQRAAEDVEHLVNLEVGKISKETQTAIAQKLVKLAKEHSSAANPPWEPGMAVSPQPPAPGEVVKLPTIEFKLFEGEAELDITLRATLKSPGEMSSVENVRLDGAMIKWRLEF
jgi:hypothetical protein